MRFLKHLVVGAVLALSTVTFVSTPASAAVTPAYVQGAVAAARSGVINNISFDQSIRAGDVVVVYAVWDNAGALTITDSQGNPFIPATPRTTWGSGWSAQTFYASSQTDGPDVVTETFATPITEFGFGYIYEYSGIAGLDGSSANAGTGSTMSTSPVNTTRSRDLLFAAGASSTTITAVGARFATRSSAFGNRVFDRVATLPGPHTVAAVQTGDAWVLQVVAFKAASTTTMPMGRPDHCQLAQIAFCDTFQTIVGGGREGDLDPAKWSFSRVTQNNNPGQGTVDNYLPFNAEFCMTHQVRLADADSFVCGEQFGESNHWMEGMNDGGVYATNSLRARQPFDFAGRTGHFVWDVDAKTEGSHEWWTEEWLTDEPVQAVHGDHPGTHSFPRNGVAFVFDADWCGNQPFEHSGSANALRDIQVYSNYQLTADYQVRSPCFTTQDDHANHFQVDISQSHITVNASDAGGTNFRPIASVNVATLPLSRGYLSFQHSQYNAAKFGTTATQTYHWHAIGFDGPVLPVDGGDEVPDALVARGDGSVNLGYQTNTPTFTLPNVDLSGVTTAYLTYSVYWFASPRAMMATINGVDRLQTDPNTDGANGYAWRYVVQPISLADLHNGPNTVALKNIVCVDQCPTVANIDLELVH